MAEGDVVVATIPKNAREELRVSLTEYQGIPLVDVRAWALPAVPGGEGAATKKGLSLRPDTWRELLPEIAKALAGGGAEPAEDEPEEEIHGGDEDPFADE